MVAAGVRFASGAVGVIEATTAAYPGFPERIEIAGTRGSASLAGTSLVVQLQDGTRIVPDAPERYSLDFQPGGRVSVRADCNRGGGSYRLDDSALSFGPIALTKMMCPPGSRDGEFLKGLGSVSAQGMSGGDLVLTLQGGAGSMRFTTMRQ